MRLSKYWSEPAEERWGQKMRRYREEAGLTMEQAAALVDQFARTSHMTIARLEGRGDAPTLGRQRMVAAVALALYGVDPAQMHLNPEADLRGIDIRALEAEIKKLRRRNGSIRKSGCTYGLWPEPTVGVA